MNTTLQFAPARGTMSSQLRMKTELSVLDKPVSIRSTRHLGSFPRAYTADWLMVGQDGGQSIDLGDRTLFVFSDTLVAWRRSQFANKYAPPPYHTFLEQRGIFLSNSAAIGKGETLRDALNSLRYFTDADGFPRELIAPTPEERAAEIRFWPEHGIYLDGTVYLYYLGIQKTEGDTVWSFRNLGTGLATLDPETGECQRIRRDGDWCLWPVTDGDFHFGVQTALPGAGQPDAGYLYVFGSIRQHFDFQTVVARVPVAQIAEPGAYEYLQTSEGGWGESLESALDLGGSSSEFSLSYNEFLGKYTMLSVEGHTRWLELRTADALLGPYSPPQRIAKVPCQLPDELTYLAFEHPKYRVNRGERIYISYCQPHFTPNELVEVRFEG